MSAPVHNLKDTIIALASPYGMGAVALIRISGPQAIEIVSRHFEPRGKNTRLEKKASHTITLGLIKSGQRVIDEVLVSLFRAPNSYTGEEVVEISCHGSTYIQQELIQHFLEQGIRHAEPGEFTLRAFLNGKMDLSQAEAVADLIASESRSAHQIALQQMRGGFSSDIAVLREKLVHFASMIELELDFVEEDVEFADRSEFARLIEELLGLLKVLIDSFALGNVMKNGIPVAIVGEPNVGKSTLLNALLNEEKAIVSDIAGTTRDAIEDELVLDGVLYRFIDTAGLRETEDQIESIGIERTYQNMEKAQLILQLFNPASMALAQMQKEAQKLKAKFPEKKILALVNKVDQMSEAQRSALESAEAEWLMISAKEKTGLEALKKALMGLVQQGQLSNQESIVSNSRHYQALIEAQRALMEVQKGLADELSGDLMAIDIRAALHALGEITGEITSDDLLGNIFANFCIGK